MMQDVVPTAFYRCSTAGHNKTEYLLTLLSTFEEFELMLVYCIVVLGIETLKKKCFPFNQIKIKMSFIFLKLSKVMLLINVLFERKKSFQFMWF